MNNEAVDNEAKYEAVAFAYYLDRCIKNGFPKENGKSMTYAGLYNHFLTTPDRAVLLKHAQIQFNPPPKVDKDPLPGGKHWPTMFGFPVSKEYKKIHYDDQGWLWNRGGLTTKIDK